MKQINEEQQAIKMYEQAFKSYKCAFLAHLPQFYPAGTGALSEEIMGNVTSAESKLRAAEAKIVKLADDDKRRE